VGTVGVISNLPFRDGSGPNGYFEVQGKTLWRENDAPLAEWRLVDADYYRTMGIPLVSGRFFTEQDDERAKPVVIVNQALARRCWPNEDAVGKRINLSSPPVWAEVVGVVGDVRTYRPGLPPPLEIAGPYGQTPLPSMSFVIRTATADPASLVAVIRREMAEVDGSLPLFDVATMEQRVRTSLAQPKLLSVLISAFAALAALLALIGVYGLMAYSTGQQRYEFGVRLAMGAAPGTLLRMVLALTRLMNSMLYQVTATDPAVLVPTCIAVFAAALAACYGPARAAARVDPIQTLGAS
jgi:putative ABC transport system permease protein